MSSYYEKKWVEPGLTHIDPTPTLQDKLLNSLKFPTDKEKEYLDKYYPLLPEKIDRMGRPKKLAPIEEQELEES